MKQALLVLALLLVASPAFAATIDFGSSQFSGATGQQSFTVDSLDLTVSASTTTGEDATLQQSSDGLGVNFGDGWAASRQIEGVELLTLTFDDLVTVTELSVANLFDWGCIQIEVGSYTINGETLDFEANSWTGKLTVPVDAAPTNQIVFRAVGDWSGWTDNGFTLASITLGSGGVTSVPELDPGALPGAIAVTVGGALVLTERRRARA